MSSENRKVVKPVSGQEKEPKFDELLNQIAKPAPKVEVKNPVEPVPVTNEAKPIEAKPIAPKVEKPEEPPKIKPIEVVEAKPTPEPIKEEPVITEKPNIEEKPKVEMKPEPQAQVSHLAEDQAKRLNKQVELAQKEPDDQKVIESIEQEIFGPK